MKIWDKFSFCGPYMRFLFPKKFFFFHSMGKKGCFKAKEWSQKLKEIGKLLKDSM